MNNDNQYVPMTPAQPDRGEERVMGERLTERDLNDVWTFNAGQCNDPDCDPKTCSVLRRAMSMMSLIDSYRSHLDDLERLRAAEARVKELTYTVTCNQNAADREYKRRVTADAEVARLVKLYQDKQQDWHRRQEGWRESSQREHLDDLAKLRAAEARADEAEQALAEPHWTTIQRLRASETEVARLREQALSDDLTIQAEQNMRRDLETERDALRKALEMANGELAAVCKDIARLKLELAGLATQKQRERP